MAVVVDFVCFFPGRPASMWQAPANLHGPELTEAVVHIGLEVRGNASQPFGGWHVLVPVLLHPGNLVGLLQEGPSHLLDDLLAAILGKTDRAHTHTPMLTVVTASDRMPTTTYPWGSPNRIRTYKQSSLKRRR